MSKTSEYELMCRASWLYYVGGLNQADTATRLGTTRARVNRLLQNAREEGVVSITIDRNGSGMLPVEELLRKQFSLKHCLCTPELGVMDAHGLPDFFVEYPRRAVGQVAAELLRDWLAAIPDATVGVGWGRTLNHISANIAGLKANKASFVSLMGSLTANNAFNPFEIVQSLAHSTGGQGFFLPVPFIADSASDRQTLISQRTVSKVLEMARHPTLAFISVGELSESSLLRLSDMISEKECNELRAFGAVGDTNGIFFDSQGHPVKHSLNERTLAVDFNSLKHTHTILLAGGIEKTEATLALLKSGIVSTLIADGDLATALCNHLTT